MNQNLFNLFETNSQTNIFHLCLLLLSASRCYEIVCVCVLGGTVQLCNMPSIHTLVRNTVRVSLSSSYRCCT